MPFLSFLAINFSTKLISVKNCRRTDRWGILIELPHQFLFLIAYCFHLLGQRSKHFTPQFKQLLKLHCKRKPLDMNERWKSHDSQFEARRREKLQSESETHWTLQDVFQSLADGKRKKTPCLGDGHGMYLGMPLATYFAPKYSAREP